jgi:hypothetical protein
MLYMKNEQLTSDNGEKLKTCLLGPGIQQISTAVTSVYCCSRSLTESK